VERGHRETARLLEKMAAENQAPVPHHLVAHHLTLAGQTRKAAEHYLAAGKRALAAQQYHLALDHLRNASNLVPPEDDRDDLALEITLALLESAKPLGERSLHELAVRNLMTHAERADKPDLKLRAMLEQCIYLRTISEHESSLIVAENLAKVAREAENSAIEAAALKEAGTTCYLMADMSKAEQYFHQAAGILASTGDRSQLARVYNNLGLVCRNTQRQEEMVRYFQRALDIFRDVNDTIGERFPLGNLGIVFFERGEFERAYDCFSALKASLGNRADLMMEAKVDFSIGEIFLEIGLYDEAREACERSLSTFLNIGNRQGESEVLGTLGGIQLARGNIQLAREYFERSIQVKREIGNVVGMLHSQITLARIANLEGRHDDALKLAREVLENARKRTLRSIELECMTEIMHAKSQIEGPSGALKILSPNEEPEQLEVTCSPALISFAYKAGELSAQAGDEGRALQYISVSAKSIENILAGIENPEWREAYHKKREAILDAYRRLTDPSSDL
jgi:tetratricopeptide (TPR) repeat protein